MTSDKTVARILDEHMRVGHKNWVNKPIAGADNLECVVPFKGGYMALDIHPAWTPVGPWRATGPNQGHYEPATVNGYWVDLYVEAQGVVPRGVHRHTQRFNTLWLAMEATIHWLGTLYHGVAIGQAIEGEG